VVSTGSLRKNSVMSVTMTILVADDEAFNRELLSELLQMEGYRVVCASEGDEALRLINGKNVDLALLDVVMPGRTGFSVCQTAKSRPETYVALRFFGLQRVESRSNRIAQFKRVKIQRARNFIYQTSFARRPIAAF